MAKKRNMLDPAHDKHGWCIAMLGMLETRQSELDLQLGALRVRHLEVHDHFERDQELHELERSILKRQEEIGEIIELIPVAMAELTANTTDQYQIVLEKTSRMLQGVADELQHDSDPVKRNLRPAIKAIARMAGTALDEIKSMS